MHFTVRFTASATRVAALALSTGALFAGALLTGLVAAPCAQAQTTATPSTTGPQPTTSGVYMTVDPLAGVRYNNKYDVSLGLAFDRMKAGPTILEGANLGGLDAEGSYWFAKHWAGEGSARMYVGTSGAGVNDANANGGAIKGPYVSETFFVAGPEWLGPHNKHGALIAHVLVGGVYGDFQKDLLGHSPSVVDFYNNQVAPAAIIGGHMDLNRSANWVFRITPDAVMTHYGINYYPNTSQFDVNFAISVGVEYKFKKKR